jgi:hypothetical protein
LLVAAADADDEAVEGIAAAIVRFQPALYELLALVGDAVLLFELLHHRGVDAPAAEILARAPAAEQASEAGQARDLEHRQRADDGRTALLSSTSRPLRVTMACRLCSSGRHEGTALSLSSRETESSVFAGDPGRWCLCARQGEAFAAIRPEFLFNRGDRI